MSDTNPYDIQRLVGQVAVVTGANGGLGSAICRRLSSEGAHIAAVDIAEPRTASEFACFVGDMTNKTDVLRVLETITNKFGRADILVNNIGGGGSPAKLLVDLDEEHWLGSIANNLTSNFLCTQAFARSSIAQKRGGKIVNIASFSGKVGTPLLGPYAVAKAGVIRLTEVFARELAEHGMRVNALCPSVIDTPLSDKMLARHPDTFIKAYDLEPSPERGTRASLEQKIPLARLGTPEEVAAFVAFLASDESAYVTGQAFNINGGLIAF